ncbi:hypothetical protein KCP74_14915 [Salmonella enterica subsp. enterica]|nr:hypothetical protein KCP74_14915 [Salmonella enterica subsp. enterica]
MAREGHEVRVITALPYYLAVGRSASAIPPRRYRREEGEATVWRRSLYVLSAFHLLKR